jgi:hypothetical protein
MTATTQLASVLVARFLRSNNYTETLNVFIREAGLPADAGQPGGKTDNSEWTIEGVLEEKQVFDESVKFERYGQNEEKNVWTVPGQPAIVPSLTCNLDVAEIFMFADTTQHPQHQMSSKHQRLPISWRVL